MISPPTPPPSLGRRNSISTTVPLPTELRLPAKSSNYAYDEVSASSFELISLKSPASSYTSLKDLLPSSAVNSPTAACSAANSAYEISIRNRLVKQAAWAYLQPMSASPGSSTGSHFLYRIWIKISSACFRLISRILSVFLLWFLTPEPLASLEEIFVGRAWRGGRVWDVTVFGGAGFRCDPHIHLREIGFRRLRHGPVDCAGPRGSESE